MPCRAFFPILGFVIISLLSAKAAPAWKEVYDPFTVRTLYLEVNEADWDRVRFDKPVEGQTDIPGDDGVMTFTDPNAVPPRFYRVTVRRP